MTIGEKVRKALEQRKLATGRGFSVVLGSAARESGRGVKHGVGRTAVADRLAAEIGAERISTGAFFREMARERGLSIEEFNRTIPSHPEWDADLDRRIAALVTGAGSEGRFVVLDSNLAAVFGKPDCAFRIDVSDETRAKRVLAGKRFGDARFETAAEALASLDRRSQEELERYQRHPDPMYKGVDPGSAGNYAAVIDNSGGLDNAVEDILGRILSLLETGKA